MTTVTVNETRPEKTGPQPPEAEALDGKAFRRRRRGRNLALLGLLAAFVVIVYLVTIVKITNMGGG